MPHAQAAHHIAVLVRSNMRLVGSADNSTSRNGVCWCACVYVCVFLQTSPASTFAKAVPRPKSRQSGDGSPVVAESATADDAEAATTVLTTTAAAAAGGFLQRYTPAAGLGKILAENAMAAVDGAEDGPLSGPSGLAFKSAGLYIRGPPEPTAAEPVYRHAALTVLANKQSKDSSAGGGSSSELKVPVPALWGDSTAHSTLASLPHAPTPSQADATAAATSHQQPTTARSQVTVTLPSPRPMEANSELSKQSSSASTSVAPQGSAGESKSGDAVQGDGDGDGDGKAGEGKGDDTDAVAEAEAEVATERQSPSQLQASAEAVKQEQTEPTPQPQPQPGDPATAAAPAAPEPQDSKQQDDDDTAPHLIHAASVPPPVFTPIQDDDGASNHAASQGEPRRASLMHSARIIHQGDVLVASSGHDGAIAVAAQQQAMAVQGGPAPAAETLAVPSYHDTHTPRPTSSVSLPARRTSQASTTAVRSPSRGAHDDGLDEEIEAMPVHKGRAGPGAHLSPVREVSRTHCNRHALTHLLDCWLACLIACLTRECVCCGNVMRQPCSALTLCQHRHPPTHTC